MGAVDADEPEEEADGGCKVEFDEDGSTGFTSSTDSILTFLLSNSAFSRWMRLSKGFSSVSAFFVFPSFALSECSAITCRGHRAR